MYIKVVTTIILILFSKNLYSATPNHLDLKSFLTDYFKNNENKKNIDLDQNIQISESQSLSNNLNGTFTINPSRAQQKDKNLQTSWERQDQVTASYKQNLPTGTTISIGGTKYLNNSPVNTRFYNRQIDNSFFIRLEQDLWKNGLGYNQRSNISLSKLNTASAKLNHSIAMATECNKAVTLFMNAYKDQRALEIYKALNISSKKTFASTKRSYQQKLTRKIDYIAAQTDLLSNEQRLLVAEMQWQYSLKELSNSVTKNITKDTPLAIPKINELKSKTSPKLSPAYTKLYDLNLKASKQDHLSQKNLNAPDVQLYLEGSKNDNQFTSATVTADQESFNVGLNINIPINDKSLKGQKKTSYYKWKKAENEKSYQLRKLSNDLQNNIKRNKKLELQLAVLEKQKNNFKRLTYEARKLLRSGRIEYKDYTQYREQELNNQLSQIDTQKNLLLGQIETSLLINPETNLCGEITK